MKFLSSVFVIIVAIYMARSSPIHGDNSDVTNDVYDDDSRRISKHHHHVQKSPLDSLDATWDYDIREEETEIIDLTGVDPCEGTICDDSQLCIVHNRTLPQCVNKIDLARYMGINGEGFCVSCEDDSNDIPVCGNNGYSFKSECELQYQACIKNVNLKLVCAGACPCPLDLIAQSTDQDMMIGDITKILGSPKNLIVTSLEDDRTSARVELNWEPPSGYDEVIGNMAITDYIIHYTEEGTAEWKSVRTPGSVNTLAVTGLRPNTMYYFRIQARTSSAIGPLSDAVFHRTVPTTRKVEFEIGVSNTFDNEDGDIVDDQDASGDEEYSFLYQE